MAHISSLLELLSDGLPVFLRGSEQWYHLVLQFIHQGLEDLPDNHTNIAVTAPGVVVEGGVLISGCQVSQGEDELQYSTQGLLQVGALLLDVRPDPLRPQALSSRSGIWIGVL